MADDVDEAEEDGAGGLVSTRTSKVVKTALGEHPTHVEIRASIELEAEILKVIASPALICSRYRTPSRRSMPR
uniref:hypothetical protein n=1 Tax=Salmonella sp. TaxID=599 RepID=UPI001CD93C43|nr:hypothetical protein [Salmonella sp.]